MLRIPGAAAEWRHSVPETHLKDDGATVICRCGAETTLEVGDVEECAGHCGRFFLRAESSMRVAKWDACLLPGPVAA